MKLKNKFLPILSSIAMMTGPSLLVVACSHEITRYNAALSNDLQNRILFDFVGVNYSVNAKSQFSSAFKQGMDFIKKDVEGIMAQQEFFNFFVQKLNYSETDANNAFIKVKDQIGLNILANDYFSTINSGQSFDSKVYANKLIFQTENWHLNGTTRFNYSASEFYADNDPDTIFSSAYLYSDLDDSTPAGQEKDAKIQEVAKHADDNYNKEIDVLTKGNPIWDSPNTPTQLPPTLQDGPSGVKDYQKKLERFKWWLRFRYQQYYYSKILPQLNETLFTMAYVLNSILKITTDSNNQIKIEIDSSTQARQLQDWGPNAEWKSQYRFVWDYTTTQTAAETINRKWTTEPLPDLMNNDGSGLNPLFLNRLAATDKTLKNTVDPTFGINGSVIDPSSKDYNDSIKDTTLSGWVDNKGDGTHYWGKNGKGSFAYSAPIYWIDVVQNLNFNYYSNPTGTPLIATGDDKLIGRWGQGANSSISTSKFSKYIRGDNMPAPTDPSYKPYQEMKWNIFWQMIYFLSSQEETNANKDIAKTNFSASAKALYPKFIRKENIYNIDFWNAVKEYY